MELVFAESSQEADTMKAEKSPLHVAAEQSGAVIEFFSAPAVNAFFAWTQCVFALSRSFMPTTADSSFGKEKP